MPAPFIDSTFVDAFKAGFIAHLKKELEANGPQNQAKKIIQDAISTEDLGKLSRVFDAFIVPIANKETFYAGLALAGNVEAYLRPILIELSSMILNADKTALHPDVIEAIGTEEYADLTGGQINEAGHVVAKENQTDFNPREKAIAEKFMVSVIVNYSQSVGKYMLNEEENDLKISKDNLAEKELQLSMSLADNEYSTLISPLQKVIRSKNNHLNELSQSIKKADQQADAILNKEQGTDLKNGIIQCYNAKIEAENYLKDVIDPFTTQIITPFQAMANGFNLEKLDATPPIKISLKDLTDKLTAFLNITNYALSEVTKLTKDKVNTTTENPLKEQEKNLQTLADSLQSAIEIPNLFSALDDESKRDKMLSSYQTGIQDNFQKVANNTQFKVEPPKPLMNIVFRLFRALAIWSLTNAAEKADQQRYDTERALTIELSGLKKTVKEDTPEPILNNKDSASAIVSPPVSEEIQSEGQSTLGCFADAGKDGASVSGETMTKAKDSNPMPHAAIQADMKQQMTSLRAENNGKTEKSEMPETENRRGNVI